jgi:hypothetical protein
MPTRVAFPACQVSPIERAEEKILEDAQPLRDNVVALASRRR